MQAAGDVTVEGAMIVDNSSLLLVLLDLGSLILLDSTPSGNKIGDGTPESPEEDEDCSMNLRVAWRSRL